VAAVLTVVSSLGLLVVPRANAAIVPPVLLATSANYAVLGASTVTNTGNSVLNGSLGLWPGTSITGFPPGLVVAPATTDVNNAAAMQAQADLTTAYVNAAGRPVDETTAADLANRTLQGGVYAASSHGALSLTGPLVLDGANNSDSVWIFQTDSSLTIASGSTVSLINGAQACNVFWQVGSSASLGTGATFVGNILALTSISLNDSVTVNGRALARNGAVTLINDVFTAPTCAPAVTTTTAVATTIPGATTTVAGATTTIPGATTTIASTVPGAPLTTVPGTGGPGPDLATGSAVPGAATTVALTGGPASSTTAPGSGTPSSSSIPVVTTAPATTTTTGQPGLPRTGADIARLLLWAGLALGVGGLALRMRQSVEAESSKPR
jgi:hypothetical protein